MITLYRMPEPQHLGCFQVDDQLELGRLQNGQVGGLFALEDPAGIDTSVCAASCWLGSRFLGTSGPRGSRSSQPRAASALDGVHLFIFEQRRRQAPEFGVVFDDQYGSTFPLRFRNGMENLRVSARGSRICSLPDRSATG